MDNSAVDKMLINSLFDTIIPFTRTVIKHTNGRLEFIGSGFLLKYDKEFLFITAAHVLDHFIKDTPLLVDSGEGLTRLIGIHAKTGSPNPSERKSDKIDLGIVLLRNGDNHLFEQIPHLKLSDLDLSDNVKKEHGFIICGCPITKNKKSTNYQDKTIKPKMLTILCWQASSECHQELKAPMNLTMALNYNLKNVITNGNKSHSPKIVGLSGAPVWGFTGDEKAVITGIVTEHHQRHIKSILCTRTSFVAQLIESIKGSVS